MPTSPDELLTPQKVAAEFGIPASTVRDLCRRQQVRHYRLSRRLLIRRGDFVLYLATRLVEVGPASSPRPHGA